MPHSSEAFYSRLVSFGPGHWGVREVTPLECSRYGWKLIQPDVMQCVTCKQVVCATLPHLVDREACKYNGFELDNVYKCSLHKSSSLHIMSILISKVILFIYFFMQTTSSLKN